MPYSRRADVYDVEYCEDRDRDFVLSLIGEDARVLEIPCGAGRLSRWLAQKARELTIVDLEPKMVARALDAVARVGGAACVSGEIADMRALELGRAFDVALVPREALQLLPPEEAVCALATISAHLTPGGRLFVDLAMFRPATSLRADPDYYDARASDGVWRENWTRRLANGIELTRRSAQQHARDSIVFDLDYRIDGVEGWRSRMRLYRYDVDWIAAATPQGSRLATVYGDYDGSDFTAMTPRLLAIYQKLS